MNCPQCGGTNVVGAESCAHCGDSLMTSEQKGQNDPATDRAYLLGTGEREGQTHGLGHRAIIGRLESCDISIDDKSVSREHARLSKLRDGYVIEDLGSTNGTKVNGSRIHDAVVLRPGDVVTIGSVELRYASGFVAGALQAATREPSESHTMVASIFGRLRRDAQDQELETHHADPLRAEIDDEEPGAAVASELHEVDMTFASDNPATSLDDEPDQTSAAGSHDQPSHSLASDVGGERSEQSLDRVESEVSSAIQRFAALARSMALRASQSDAEQARLKERLEAADASSRFGERAMQSLNLVRESTITDEEVDILRNLVGELVHSPRDIDVLMRISQNADKLTSLLDETIRLRSTLKDMSDAQ